MQPTRLTSRSKQVLNRLKSGAMTNSMRAANIPAIQTPGAPGSSLMKPLNFAPALNIAQPVKPIASIMGIPRGRTPINRSGSMRGAVGGRGGKI